MPTHSHAESAKPRPDPRRAAATLRLLRETLIHVTGDAAEGERLAWALLRAWAGTVVRVPTLADVERLATEEALVRRLLRDPSHAAVRHAATHQGMPVRDASRVFRHRPGAKGGLQLERARRSTTPGLTCRVPRLNRWRKTVVV